MLVHKSLDCFVVVVKCGCESYFLWGGLVVICCYIVHTVKVVVLLLVGGI